MKIRTVVGSILVLSVWYSAPGFAAKCQAPDISGDVSGAQMSEFYRCIQPALRASYGKKGNDVGTDYVDWESASKFPVAPGVHSGQHLMTYVNSVGYDAYIQYDGDVMPNGTIIAKESFTIKSGGKWKKGPLLIMTKVGDSASSTGGWEYSGVKPNGKKLSVDGPGFCHACHQAYATQDSLGYPIPDARIN